MDMGADAMPVPDRLRSRWRSPGTASAVGDPSAPEADDVLLMRVADGDAAALTALYRRYGGRLFAFLQRSAGDRMKSRLHHARAALARSLADRGYVEEMP
jgi:hypothetical protein